MKRAWVVIRSNGEIAAIFTTEKKAKRFSDEFGYTYESYLLE